MQENEQQRLYTFTNESLEAVVSGLDVQANDIILVLGSSGDQAFALLEAAKQVIVVDYSKEQLEYIKKRAQLLANGDFKGFLRVEQFWLDVDLENLEKKIPHLEARNKYFSYGNRLNNIRTKLHSKGSLRVCKEDILEYAAKGKGFSKIYLSSALGYAPKRYNKEQVIDSPIILENIAKNLPSNGLIYVSNHMGLTARYIVWGMNIKSSKIKKIESFGSNAVILPPNLELNRELSKKAQQFENLGWIPAVYRKIKSLQDK